MSEPTAIYLCECKGLESLTLDKITEQIFCIQCGGIVKEPTDVEEAEHEQLNTY